jgi:hypothetical protein
MPPRQVLPRTLNSIHIGAVKSMQEKTRQDSEYDLTEIELQYQIAVSGEASAVLAWADPVTLAFEWGFHYAPMQRDSELELPHFTYGGYIVTETPVALLAVVKSWKEDPDNGAITGADVSIGFLAGPVAPGDDGTGAVALEQTVTFQGFLHASFQGLAQSLDETSENPDLEVTG